MKRLWVESSVRWGGTVITTGTPCKPVDYRYRSLTVCVVSPLCAVCIINVIWVTVICHSKEKYLCLQMNMHQRQSSVMSCSVSSCFVAILNALGNNKSHHTTKPSVCENPSVTKQYLHYLAWHYFIAVMENGQNCWVQDRHNMKLQYTNIHTNPYSRMKEICVWSHTALTNSVNLDIWLAVHHSITFLLLPTWYTNFWFIHTKYIKLNFSTCFERNPLIIRRSMTQIIRIPETAYVQFASLTSWWWADCAQNM
jgi:hypothetical protein